MNIKKSKIILPFLIAFSPFAMANYEIKVFIDGLSIKSQIENPITGSASLSPSTINRGESSTLSWNYEYASEVSIAGLGTYGKTGSISVNSLASRNYIITAKNGSVSKTDNVSLTVIQPASDITFTTDKSRIGIGQSVNLSWNVSNSANVDIDNGIGNGLGSNGNINISPTASTTYTLSSKDFSNNLTSKSLFIDVVNNSLINSFTASKLNVTKGESVVFNWDVSDSEGLYLTPFGAVSGTPTGSQSVPFNTVGVYDFTLKSTSLSGTEVTSSPISINVYNPAVINSYTINESETTIDVSPNDTLDFAWNVSDALSYKLNGNVVGGTSTSLVVGSTTGTTDYKLEALNGAGAVVNKTISVNVVGLSTINSFTGPTNVFIDSPFFLNWSANDVVSYKLKGSNATSGVPSSETDYGTATNASITPTVSGNYTYTLSAYNTANAKAESTASVVAESIPTFTGFTVNGQSTINVAPSTALTFAGTGFSAGSVLQARNSSDTANASFPSTAPASNGTTTYYGVATKSLNSVTKNSALRSVSVTVVAAPTLGTITAPTNVFTNNPFTISWSGTDVSNYKIVGNAAGSGVGTELDLGTATSTTITPTGSSGGTWTYTITATNAVGVSTTATKTVVAEQLPTITNYTVNGAASINVTPNTTLTFASTTMSAGASLQARDSANTTDTTFPTNSLSTAGSTFYYAVAKKTVNGITKYSTILRSTVVKVYTDPVFTSATAPSNVFANTAFTLSWNLDQNGTIKIRGNSAASGVSTTDVDLGSGTTSRVITPTAAGTYTYTLTGTNVAGGTGTITKTVVVEDDPTFSGFTVNNATSITVAKSTALTYGSSGLSTGATFIGRNSTNTADSALPTTAPTTSGTFTYYGAATKTVNGVTKYSAVRNVTVIVPTPTYVYDANNRVVYCALLTAPGMTPAQVRSAVVYGGVTVYQVGGGSCGSAISTGQVIAGNNGKTYTVGASQGGSAGAPGGVTYSVLEN